MSTDIISLIIGLSIGNKNRHTNPITEWATIRKLDSYPIRWETSSLPYDHKWEPPEILADEYAVLFGAPELKTYPNFVSLTENQDIPSPESVENLRSYWSNLSNIPVPPTIF